MTAIMEFLAGMFVGGMIMGMIWIHDSRVRGGRDKLKRRL